MRHITETEPELDNICRVGVIASIKQTLMLPGNATHLIVEGVTRVVISDIEDNGKYLTAVYEEVPQDTKEKYDEVTDAYMRIVADSANTIR